MKIGRLEIKMHKRIKKPSKFEQFVDNTSKMVQDADIRVRTHSALFNLQKDYTSPLTKKLEDHQNTIGELYLKGVFSTISLNKADRTPLMDKVFEMENHIKYLNERTEQIREFVEDSRAFEIATKMEIAQLAKVTTRVAKLENTPVFDGTGVHTRLGKLELAMQAATLVLEKLTRK